MSTRYVMGTFLRVDAFGSQADAAQRAIFDRIQALEDLLSFYRPDSDISRINRGAGGGPIRVHADTFAAVSAALRYAELTEGAFDPTYRSERGDFRGVRLTEGSIELPEGMPLDLGGIGKGWAMDRALEELLPACQVSRLILNFGGQLLFWDRSGRFEPREVAIEDPRDGCSFLETFPVDGNCSVSTSSQGERPGHLRDPRVRKAAAGCLSATAVAESGAQAEALSTALFILGPAAAPTLLGNFSGARAHLHS